MLHVNTRVGDNMVVYGGKYAIFLTLKQHLRTMETAGGRISKQDTMISFMSEAKFT